MGQKVNPVGFRTGVIRSWDSKWFAKPALVPALVKEDFEIRKYLLTKFKVAGLSHVEIERVTQEKKELVRVIAYCAKQSLLKAESEVDGVKKASLQDQAQAYLKKLTKKDVTIYTRGVVKPERIAYIAACKIAEDLENRVSFRKAQKTAISRALKAGAKGIKTKVSGRLGGAEIARTEGYSEGRVPLHTLRADVDYATAEAMTTYGKLGVKVWIYMGEVLPGMTREDLVPKQPKTDYKPYPRTTEVNEEQRPKRTLGKAVTATVSTVQKTEDGE